jgi:mono/diheme cytochrome c family protein
MIIPSRRAVILCLAVAAASPAAADDIMRRGEYLLRAAGCANCHTDEKNKGVRLAGGRALETPFGTFYSPNITPDPATGIGTWSEADFVRALREGVDNEGSHLYPAFPYTSYTQLTDSDLHAINTYLFSQKPVIQENKGHELPWYLRFRELLWIWKRMFFNPGPFQPQPNQSAAWNRGAYLATAVAHCGECHTPRNFLGGFRNSKRFAGNPHGADDADVPNITPDKNTGIGKWSQGDLVEYLDTGAMPDGDYAGDAMAEVIDNSLSHLTNDDRKAIAIYVMSLPAVESAVPEHKHRRKNSKSNNDYE